MNISTQIFDKKSSLWSEDILVQNAIDNRLGWLESVEFSLRNQAKIESFVKSVKVSNFKQVLLLGMGGSGLAPEVFSRIFIDNQGLEVLVLDSTCSEQILSFEAKIDIDNTLFIVSSKSGDTLETLSLFEYFYAKVSAVNNTEPGAQFVAITDANSELESLAKAQHFLHCFINPSDIGGRFSALSYFGLVPAALSGVSLDKLLFQAQKAMQACSEGRGDGNKLGEWLVQGYQEQQLDKLILHVPEHLTPMVWWIEQLVAESLGKLGQGILPVLQVDDAHESEVELVNSKHLYISMGKAVEDFSDIRVAHWGLIDEYDVAAHFFHWEYAVALAGIALAINPFDEPNVTEAKVRTRKLLNENSTEAIQVSSSQPIESFLTQASEDSYVSILAYWPMNSVNEAALQKLKVKIERQISVPVTINYGPRYLHSTGQLHKGGKQQGLFIVLGQESEKDVAIPKKVYTFNVLCRAQALGDFQILTEKGLPAVFYALTEIAELADYW